MVLASHIFLLPNWTFVAELILFMIVLGTIAKFILPPIQKVQREREQTVRASVEAGDTSRVEAERLTAEAEQVLASAREEARRVLDEARQGGERLRTEERAQADAERQRLVDAAAAEIAAERAAVRAEALDGAASLIVAAAEQVLGASIDPSRHQDVIDAVVHQAPRSGSAR